MGNGLLGSETELARHQICATKKKCASRAVNFFRSRTSADGRLAAVQRQVRGDVYSAQRTGSQHHVAMEVTVSRNELCVRHDAVNSDVHSGDCTSG